MNSNPSFSTTCPKDATGNTSRSSRNCSAILNSLSDGSALKIPLSELPDSKENIRSALNRATRQRGIEVATSSDDEFLYVWNVEPDSGK